MKDNELLTKPIGALIKNLAIPASLGFFFNTMFNVLDTFYAGRFGTSALAALFTAFYTKRVLARAVAGRA